MVGASLLAMADGESPATGFLRSWGRFAPLAPAGGAPSWRPPAAGSRHFRPQDYGLACAFPLVGGVPSPRVIRLRSACLAGWGHPACYSKPAQAAPPISAKSACLCLLAHIAQASVAARRQEVGLDLQPRQCGRKISGNGLVGGTLTPLGHRKATATVLRQGGSRGFAPTRVSRNQKTKTDLDTAPPSLCQVVSIKGTLKSNCPLYLYAFSREAAAHGPAAHFLSPRWIEATCLSAPASPPSGMATGSSCASSETQGCKTTAPDTAYRYRVRAITRSGLPGGFSAEAVAATKAKPVAAAPSSTSGRP